MVKVGITGGIGAGKSIISKLLKKNGYFVFDTDSEAKKIMNESIEIKNFLISELGPESIVNNKINKPFIADKIFNNDDLRLKLNKILHPLVFRKFLEESERSNHKIVFIESAILFESGLDKYVDYIISVTAPIELRVNRVVDREKCDSGKVYERINSQLSQEEKNRLSDYIIYNDETSSLINQVDVILDSIKK